MLGSLFFPRGSAGDGMCCVSRRCMMAVRRAVCEWKGIEFLPVVHQLVQEKLCAQEGGGYSLVSRLNIIKAKHLNLF
jgi:hypothetical protein